MAEIVFPWLFLNRAEQTLSSSTAAILISAVPVVGVLIALLTRRAERLGRRGLLGLVLGTVGVTALVGLDLQVSDLGAVAEMGVVVVGYAIGPVVLARYLGDLPGLPVVTAGVVVTALIYLPLVLLGPGLPTTVPSGDVLVAVAVLTLVCTAGAFLLLFALIGEIGPVRATTIVYFNPVVAVAAGAAFLDEKVTAWTLLGFVLVLAGSYLVNGGAPEREQTEVTAPPEVGAGPLSVIVGDVSLTATTEASFAADVLASPLPVLVEFSADWCPPCQMIAPVLEQIAGDEAGRLRVLMVDVDDNPVVADLYQVTAMPTLVLLRGGREVARVKGVKPRELILAEIAPHL